MQNVSSKRNQSQVEVNPALIRAKEDLKKDASCDGGNKDAGSAGGSSGSPGFGIGGVKTNSFSGLGGMGGGQVYAGWVDGLGYVAGLAGSSVSVFYSASCCSP